MGFFSDIAIDSMNRTESGRVEWAVILTDEKRPATLWKVTGRARGYAVLERGTESRTVPDAELWVIA